MSSFGSKKGFMIDIDNISTWIILQKRLFNAKAKWALSDQNILEYENTISVMIIDFTGTLSRYPKDMDFLNDDDMYIPTDYHKLTCFIRGKTFPLTAYDIAEYIVLSSSSKLTTESIKETSNQIYGSNGGYIETPEEVTPNILNLMKESHVRPTSKILRDCIKFIDIDPEALKKARELKTHVENL